MKTKRKLIKEYTENEAMDIARGLVAWITEIDDKGDYKPHIFIDEFLFLNKQMIPSDLEYLIETNKDFKCLIDQATAIELLKLKKYAAAEQLNASIVSKILTNKHNWI